jgi:polysaccharide export outer membrane protein
VQVTITEPGAGGLFSGPPAIENAGTEPGARVVTLPDLTVDPDGRVTVPFAGAIAVNGLTQVEAAERIQQALAGQAVQPQVSVNAAHSIASRITVAGAVKTPGALPLQSTGETILEAVARAGGSTELPKHVVVQLNRFGNVHRVRMDTLLDHPETNIHVRAGDYIHLLVEAREYQVMGATDHVLTHRLDNNQTRLSAALADAGGPLDARADSTAVMLFRTEPPEIMDRIAAVEARLARARGEAAPVPETPPPHQPKEAPVPVIFLLDLRSASGMFLAQQLKLHERDIIYVPGSGYGQLQKFLDLLRASISPVSTGASTSHSL